MQCLLLMLMTDNTKPEAVLCGCILYEICAVLSRGADEKHCGLAEHIFQATRAIQGFCSHTDSIAPPRQSPDG